VGVLVALLVDDEAVLPTYESVVTTVVDVTVNTDNEGSAVIVTVAAPEHTDPVPDAVNVDREIVARLSVLDGSEPVPVP